MRLLRIAGNSIYRKLRAIVSEVTCCAVLWKDSETWSDVCAWRESDNELWENESLWNNNSYWP